VLLPVVVARVGSGATRTPILERDRIGGQHYESGAGERWSERLERVADETEHLRLAEVALTSVLVEHDDGREQAST